MAEAASGSREAFAAIVERHHRLVYRVAWRYLGHEEDAKDAAQTAFVRAWGAAGSWRQTGSVRGWLLRITANVCLGELASARRRLLVLTGDEPAHGRPAAAGGDVAAGRELRERLRRAIGELPPAQRMALVLSKYEGLGYAEVARAMGRSVAAVESLIARAKLALVERLREETGETRGKDAVHGGN